MEQLGRAKSKRVAKENNTVIVDVWVDEDAELQNQKVFQIAWFEETKSEFDKENYRKDLQNWLAAAVIRVGASTETEMKEAKLRLKMLLQLQEQQ